MVWFFSTSNTFYIIPTKQMLIVYLKFGEFSSKQFDCNKKLIFVILLYFMLGQKPQSKF